MDYEICKNCRWFKGCCYNPDRQCITNQSKKETEGLVIGFSFGGETDG